MRSNYTKPLNLGSDEMVTMNEMMTMAAAIEDKKVELKHIKGPEGVRGRNSDNTLIKQELKWAPGTSLKDGLRKTYTWIKEQIEAERKAGIDVDKLYGSSKVVTQTTDSLKAIGATVTHKQGTKTTH